MSHGFKRIMNGEEPAITQPNINGHSLSWNPDDGRFYVQATVDPASETLATFREWKNAVYYAKTH